MLVPFTLLLALLVGMVFPFIVCKKDTEAAVPEPDSAPEPEPEPEPEPDTEEEPVE
ncbi:MAG: hypothetical protein ACTSUB_10465 [Candidatus Thorarchaeota archaeon]